MNLVIFPMKQENPYPEKVSTGSAVKMNDRTMLCCTGMGSMGPATLETVLSEHPDIDAVWEFGTAASVSKGIVGRLYECTSFRGIDGNLLGSLEARTHLPAAAVTGDDNVYTGTGFEWAEALETPLLYTMETLRFRETVTAHGKRFTSIRLVSDCGSGDIRAQVMDALGKARKQVKDLFVSIEKSAL